MYNVLKLRDVLERWCRCFVRSNKLILEIIATSMEKFIFSILLFVNAIINCFFFSIQFDGEFVNGGLTWVYASNLCEIALRHLTRSIQKFLVPYFPLAFCSKKARSHQHALGKLKHIQLRAFCLSLNYAKYFDSWVMRSNVHPARGLQKKTRDQRVRLNKY